MPRARVPLLLLLLTALETLGSPPTAIARRDARERAVPPEPRYSGFFEENHDQEKIANRVKSWTPNDKQNPWELSGLFQGDIMPTSASDTTGKNGLLDDTARWPGATIPYHIHDDDFDEEDVAVIKGALKEYEEKTCLRFRPYKEGDEDFVTVRGSNSGCWSLVGRHGKGQVVNLQNPGCVRHGVVVHEMMHALGFYHQQSSSDRDEWVEIHWDNIQPGKEHNFNKYDGNTVTDYGIGYDYKSVMHYSGHAFSKNGEPTITPTKEKVKLGQREGLSKKDVAKLREMYKEECGDRKPEGTGPSGTAGNGPLAWLFE